MLSIATLLLRRTCSCSRCPTSSRLHARRRGRGVVRGVLYAILYAGGPLGLFDVRRTRGQPRWVILPTHPFTWRELGPFCSWAFRTHLAKPARTQRLASSRATCSRATTVAITAAFLLGSYAVAMSVVDYPEALRSSSIFSVRPAARPSRTSCPPPHSLYPEHHLKDLAFAVLLFARHSDMHDGHLRAVMTKAPMSAFRRALASRYSSRHASAPS